MPADFLPRHATATPRLPSFCHTTISLRRFFFFAAAVDAALFSCCHADGRLLMMLAATLLFRDADTPAAAFSPLFAGLFRYAAMLFASARVHTRRHLLLLIRHAAAARH